MTQPTRARIVYEKGRMTLAAPGVDDGCEMVRGLADSDFDLLARCGVEYRDACRHTHPADALLKLGVALYEWLNGDGGWLERLFDRAHSPILVEFAVPRRRLEKPGSKPDQRTEGDRQRTFLNAPWELVADDTGHLAARSELVWCPCRRLGRAIPRQPSPFRLSTIFMAALPRELEQTSSLRYEEEEAAILRATDGVGMDLRVEESGNVRGLAELLAAESASRPVDVLHISCHGSMGAGGAALELEDELGRAQSTPMGRLATEIVPHRPGLMFLSACHTAEPARLVDCLAAEAVTHGFPAVLGWAGPVDDSEATSYATALYSALSMGADLTLAAACGRLELLNPPRNTMPGRARGWHRACLYLGTGGGKLGRPGGQARRRRPRDHAQKAFLDRRTCRVEVAAPEEFVGRRRQLQDILRTFGEPRGVLIHGVGRQGKSSLAARVSQRLPDHCLVLVHEHYGCSDILREFASATKVREVVELAQSTGSAWELEIGLRRLLEGALCETNDEGARPVLLVVDDFERALIDPPPGERLHRVNPDCADAIVAVIRAFSGAATQSRLLFTSRHAFTLPDEHGRDVARDLEWLALPSMRPPEAQKQFLAKAALVSETGAASSRHRDRIVELADGNPGLQDFLFKIAVAAPKECAQLLDELARFRRGEGVPDADRLREFIEELALPRLLACLTRSQHDLLRALSLFKIPIPERAASAVAHGLGADAGAALSRLIALGLCERHDDLVDPGVAALLATALARPHLSPLSEDEQRAIAACAVSHLAAAWPSRESPYLLDHELCQVARLAGAADVMASHAPDAVAWLRSAFRYPEAAELGVAAIRALDAVGISPSLSLLRNAAEMCATTGDENAQELLGRAMKRLDSGEEMDPLTHAAVLLAGAEDCARRGALTDARHILDEVLGVLPAGEYPRERAVTMGQIADILYRRGELEEAERIRREEQLPVFERLGDVRSRAVTMGKIADILESRGELEEAERIRREEQLPVYERLGDVDGTAGVRWRLGMMALQREDSEAALEDLATSYELNRKLRRLDGICVVGCTLGQLLCAAGETDEGLTILRRSREGFLKLGQAELAKQVANLISRYDQPTQNP